MDKKLENQGFGECASPRNDQRTTLKIKSNRHFLPLPLLPLQQLLLHLPPLLPCLHQDSLLSSTPCTVTSAKVCSFILSRYHRCSSRLAFLLCHRHRHPRRPCAHPTVAESVKSGVEAAGGSATIFQYVSLPSRDRDPDCGYRFPISHLPSLDLISNLSLSL